MGGKLKTVWPPSMPEMGDEMKLLCSETRLHNDAKKFKDIFLSKSKLPDDFWAYLFVSNCPEGLGEVNEKFRNGEDLSSSDFKTVGDLSLDCDNGCCNVECGINKPRVVQFDTPLLKSLSNTSHSPSLFSPAVIHGYNGKKGPDSSTPLPSRPALSYSAPDPAIFITTPTLGNNAFHNNMLKTPLTNVLDQTSINAKTTTSKLSRSLSATLEMDPVDNMNLSWTSSLATPPEHTEKTNAIQNGDLKGTSSLDASEIFPVERVKRKIEPKKGVARVLFINESQSFEENIAKDVTSEINDDITLERSAILKPMPSDTPVKNETFDNSSAFEKSGLTDRKCSGCFIGSVETTVKKSYETVVDGIEEIPPEIAEKSNPGLVGARFVLGRCSCNTGCDEILNHTVNDVDYFDTSLLSPLHGSVEQAMVELSTMVDTRKSSLSSTSSPDSIRERSVGIDYTKENVLKDYKQMDSKKHIEAANEVVSEVPNAPKHDVHPKKHESNPRENNPDFYSSFSRKCNILDVNNDEKRHTAKSNKNTDGEVSAVVHTLGKSDGSKDEDNQILFDMDTLSEFPFDYEFPERMIHPSGNAKDLNLDQKATVCVLKENECSKQEYFSVKTSDQDGAGTECYNGSLNNVPFSKNDKEVNMSNQTPEAVSSDGTEPDKDMMKKDGSANIFTEQSKHLLDVITEKTTLNNCFDENKYEVTATRNQEHITSKSSGNVETASQVLQDLSLQYLRDIAYDAGGISDLQVCENNVNYTFSIKSMENLTNTDNEIGHFVDGVTNVDSKFSRICDPIEPTKEYFSDEMLNAFNEEDKVQISGNDENKWLEKGVDEALKEPSGRILNSDSKNGETILRKRGRGSEKGCFGFSTASGKKLTVSEESLKKARQILNEINDEDSKSQGGGRVVDKGSFGFSMASGNKVTVSDVSLNKERQILNEVSNDEEMKCQVEESVDEKAGVAFCRASGKEVGVFEESLVKARKSKCCRNVVEKGGLGISTASTKIVADSEQSLKKENQILNEVDVDEKSKFQVGVSMASGKKVKVSEEVDRDEERKSKDGRKVDEKHIIGFSTASGRKVTVSDESLKRARQILSEVKNDECQDGSKVNENARVGFSTASGQKVKFSEQSLMKSRRTLNEVDRDEENENADGRTANEKPINGFSTASGRTITVSEKSLKKARQILNEVKNDEENRCKDGSKMVNKDSIGFCTASGNMIKVSEESLMKARRILNEVDKNNENKCSDGRKANEKPVVGFSTASGRNVTVSEKSLKKARQILNEVKNDEENKCQDESKVIKKARVGFSTASGQKVKVSEESLIKARRTLNEVDKDEENKYTDGTTANERPISGFSTASGRNVTVSEKSLKKARQILNEVKNDEENKYTDGTKANERPISGFSTASGRNVTVSEKSLKRARQILNEVKNDEENKCQDGSKVIKKDSIGFCTASGNMIKVSEESLMKARRILNEVDKDNENKCSDGRKANEKPVVGFSTASGRNVTVSEKSLKKARQILNEVKNDEENKCQDESKVIKKARVGFSTASGQKVKVSEESLINARRTLNEVDKDEENKYTDGTKANERPISGFSTASGRNVTVSEKSLKKARQILNEVKNDEENKYTDGTKANERPISGFSTASGRNVTVSEKSLKKARQILNEVKNDEENKYTDGTTANERPISGFSTASGRNVTVSEKSLKKARQILNEVKNDEENKYTDGTKANERPISGFSTASGRNVTVSEKSLKRARQILNEVKNDEENKCQDGSKVIKKDSIGFCTASGNMIKVSEESLMKARRILNEVDKDNENKCSDGRKANEKPVVGFSTASGRNVTVSEKSLKKARQILNEVKNDEENKCQDESKVIKKARVGFSTASGQKVKVSEESLINARRTLNEVDKDEENKYTDGTKANERPISGFSTASGRNVTVSEKSLKKARQILNEVKNDEENKYTDGTKANERPISGFSTASGRNVTVSEKSLKKARQILNEVNNDEENKCQDGSKVIKKDSIGFCTASGNMIKVSEESLMKARRILNEVDKDNENKSNDGRKGNEKFIGGFSTASAKNVTVSEVSLKKARTILNDEEKRKDGTKVGFPTASGKKVKDSEESLLKARTIFNEVKNDEESKCHGGEKMYGNASLELLTVSARKVGVSEESLKKAQDILSGMKRDKENQCQDSRRVEGKYEKKITVSEESLDNFKHTLNGEDKDDENLFCNVPTAMVKKVAVSDESFKKARMLTVNTREVNVLEQLMPDLPGMIDAAMIPKLFNNSSEMNLGTNGLQIANNIHLTTDDMSERTSREISEISAMLWLDDSFIDLSQLIGTKLKEKDCNNKETTCPVLHKNGKRSLSETGLEDVRPCKIFRTEKGLSIVVNEASLRDNQEESRSCMKPYSSDPLEVYTGRKYSKFKSPMKPIVTSPDSDCSNQSCTRNQTSEKCFTPHRSKSNTDVHGEQRHFKESSVNVMTTRKSNSHFVTPYRTAESNGKSVNREWSVHPIAPQSSTETTSNKHRSDLENKKNAKVEDKKCLVKPQAGSIYKLRNSSSFKRISFAEYVGNLNRNWSSRELYTYGIPAAVLSITCENAQSYRFKGSDFLSDNACQSNVGVRFTEGAVLFLGQDQYSGVEEFTNAFLHSPGVDCNLINKQWVANHYRWIIWKLASYEVVYPNLFFGRCLTPDMVLRQLKYRYDREIDRSERSAIKKILERDEASYRGMVFCVSDMNPPDSNYEVKNGTKANCQNINLEKQKFIMMTDGWYNVRVQLDVHLQSLAKEGKIFTGQKLYIQGAELLGSDQAVSPLEAPCNLHLRIHGNSTRPAKKYSRLGFHCKNSTFTVPIQSLSSDGGLVSSIDVVVARQYPLQFMEKLSDGSCVFRNPRCEERVAKKFEQEIQRKREKTMFQVQAEIDQEEMQTKRCKRRKRDSLSTEKIQSLSDGKEIYDAINNASDLCSMQEALSDEQKRSLDNYARSIQENKIAAMRRQYDEAWKKLCDEETLERNVVPVLKAKLVDSLSPKRKKTEGTALLTVWRPSEQIITMLAEGKRLKIYNVYASRYNKSTNNIQLSANRSTLYKELPFETKFQEVFQARKVYSFGELSKGLKPGVEVDVVAVVISHSSQSNLTLVYLADPDLNFVRLKIWGGLEDEALQNIIREKAVVAACNLMSQPDRRSGIPSLKYYELSVVSTNPSNKLLRNKLRELRKSVLDADTYIIKAKAKLNELCGEPPRWATPKGRASSALHSMSSHSVDTKRTPETPLQSSREVQVVSKKQAFSAPANHGSISSPSPKLSCSKTEDLQQSRKRLLQLKRRKLDLIPNPPPLSPLPCNLTSSVMNEFKIPRRITNYSK